MVFSPAAPPSKQTRPATVNQVHPASHEVLHPTVGNRLENPQILLLIKSNVVREALTIGLDKIGLSAMEVDCPNSVETTVIASARVVVSDFKGLNDFSETFQSAIQAARVPVLVVADQIKSAHVLAALRSGYCGLADWESGLSELATVIAQLATAERTEYWCPAASQLLKQDGPRKQLSDDSLFCRLTERQIEVLKYLAQGMTVKEVAQLMHLSQKSIDSHKYRIMNRLHIHDRVHLARLAIREGLIEA